MPNKFQVCNMLALLLPSDTRSKVADWVEDRNYRVAGLDAISAEEYRNIDHAEQDTLAEAVYDAYCHARGIGRVYNPDNLDRATDLVAVKFHFADGKAMLQGCESLHRDVKSGLAQYPWRGQYLTRQTIADKDLLFAINSWFKVWREAWTTGQEAFFAQCQDKHLQKSVVNRIYSKEELFEAVQELLCAHAQREYTYNQVADALQIDKKQVRQVMTVKDVLERVSDPKQNIYDEVIKYVTRPNKKGAKSATVYKWAPLRRKLDRNPLLRGCIIKEAVVDFIRNHPDCSQRAIMTSMRSEFGQLDKMTIPASLKALVADDLIDQPRRGPHNIYLYRIAKGFAAASTEIAISLAVKPLNPSDLFGTEDTFVEEELQKIPVKTPWHAMTEEEMMRMACRRPPQKPS